MPERRLRVPVAALAAALPLAVGCSSNGAATGTPPPLVSTSASSPSASPTVTPTVTPTATTAVNTDAAVLAAVPMYVDALDRLAARLDLAAYEQVTTSACVCRSDIRQIVNRLKSMHAHTSAVYRANHTRLIIRKNDQAVLYTTISNGDFSVIDSSGRILRTVRGSSDDQRLDLRLQDGHWLIESIEEQT